MPHRLHQTLHGYRDGHRLLQSSVTLPVSAQRVLLELSDRSGAGSVAGFDCALTGYPVPDTSLYALAMTWDAPEMPRAGCVWTHTLLLDDEVIRAGRFARLLSRFQRPGPLTAIDAYTQPIETDDVEGRSPMDAASDGVTADDAALVLRQLYGEPDEPARVAAASSTTYIPLILQIWEQQWSALRWAFTFCSGALSPRTLMDRPFDLQVRPLAADRRWPRHLEGRTASPDTGGNPSEEWVAVAVADFSEPDGALRRLMRQLARELPASRAAFRPLVERFIAHRDGAQRPLPSPPPQAGEGTRERLTVSARDFRSGGTTRWLEAARSRAPRAASADDLDFWTSAFSLAVGSHDVEAFELAARAFEALDGAQSDRLRQLFLNGALDQGWPVESLSALPVAPASIEALAETAASDDWYRRLRPRFADLRLPFPDPPR